MAYLVLARKWRPQRFEDVVGQEHVTTTLRNAIAQQRIAHAFLFSGPRGVGKTTVARLLAKALNCAQGPTAEPCGTCASCLEITGGSALDVAEIDGASNTGVDNIRDLNESVRYRPASARFKIVIIDEVHMLSTAAFNALLKTLEEPPEHVKFIFATTEVQKLPQTVVSRCQRYEFKRIPTAEMVERLRCIAADETIAASDAALFGIAREADGSMRDAQSLLDQVIVFAGKEIGEGEVRAALGVADRTLLHQVTAAILERDPGRCLRAVEELHRFGYEVVQFCRDLVRQMRNLTVAALFQDRGLLADLPDNEVQETLRQAALRPPEDLQRLFRLAQSGADEVRRSMLPVLVLEMMLVKMATMPDAVPVADLVARLEEMERRLGGGGEPPGGRGPERTDRVAGTIRPAAPPSAAPARSRAGTTAADGAAAVRSAEEARNVPPPRSGAPGAASGGAPGMQAAVAAAPSDARGAIAAAPADAHGAIAGVPGGIAAAPADAHHAIADVPGTLAAAPAGARSAVATTLAGAHSAVAAVPAGEREPAQADQSGTVPGAWAAFLASAEARLSLRMYLHGSRPLAETADTLHIGVETEFAERALLQQDNLALLQSMVARAYGGPRRILVSIAKPSAEDVALRMAAEETRRRELAERASASPTVRSAIEILGGEVTDVRPRSRGGSDEPR